MNWLKKLEQWIGGGEGGGKKIHTFRLLIIIGLIGIAFMLFNSFVHVKKIDTGGVGREPPSDTVNTSASVAAGTDGTSPFDSIEEEMENKTKDILEKIVGVGSVDVMVTVDSTEETVFQRNVKDSQQSTDETDGNGGKRHITEYTRDGEIVTYEVSGDQQPIVTKKVKPQVRGVLVVAKGAENKIVKQMIVDAVEKGLNVPAYRISVAPRKTSE
ncbi:stage III sporulation protein AG [Paenibacillus yonginensis]|uniref:Stage III sporulation protein AG n=1 Tax=Paenibacillus yonginensis TaxID=1462996 RepID=A0A1B1N0K1_9BACL|nr:stage III sporulation protein AG [Paenibacillus yonginensis]ANS74936.1 stage III sporulation protein AG [Paenibacillus yonginensis]